jgi:hypothetical protein
MASRKQLDLLYYKITSKNVIPEKAGIQKLLTLLDSRLRGSDESEINRGSHKFVGELVVA